MSEYLKLFLKERKVRAYIDGPCSKGDGFNEALQKLEELSSNGQREPSRIMELLHAFCIYKSTRAKITIDATKDPNIHQHEYWRRRAMQEIISWIREEKLTIRTRGI